MQVTRKTYAIISISDLKLIDFSQIDETSKYTIRLNIELTKFVIKWEEIEPSFIIDKTVIPLQVLNHSKCSDLMETSEWSEEENQEEAKK